MKIVPDNHDELERKKARGKAGLKGCLLQGVLLAIVIAYIVGFMNGSNFLLTNPRYDESSNKMESR